MAPGLLSARCRTTNWTLCSLSEVTAIPVCHTAKESLLFSWVRRELSLLSLRGRICQSCFGLFSDYWMHFVPLVPPVLLRPLVLQSFSRSWLIPIFLHIFLPCFFLSHLSLPHFLVVRLWLPTPHPQRDFQKSQYNIKIPPEYCNNRFNNSLNSPLLEFFLKSVSNSWIYAFYFKSPQET